MKEDQVLAIREGAFSSILYWSKRKDVADDFAQETVLRILEKEIDIDFDCLKKAQSYGAVMAYRLWIDAKKKRCIKCLSIIDEMSCIPEEKYNLPFGASDDELYSAIEKLPRHLKKYVNEVLLNGKMNKEYAIENNIDVTTTLNYSRSVKNRLKKILLK